MAAEDGAVTVVSLTDTVFHALKHQLDNPEYQQAEVVAAGIFGLILLTNGELVFRWLVIVATGVMGFVLALNEVSAYQPNVRHVIGLEVGLACAYVAWLSIEGVMLTAFSMFGAFVAYKTKDHLFLLEDKIGENPWYLVIWYSLWTLLGMFVVVKKKHVDVLAVVSPLLGAVLLSAAFSWLLTTETLNGVIPSNQPNSSWPEVQPVQGSFVDFAMFLVDPTAKDVGVFANTQFENPSLSWMHGSFCADRVLGLVFGLVVFFIGFKIQRNELNKWRGCKAREQVQPLTAPLLEECSA